VLLAEITGPPKPVGEFDVVYEETLARTTRIVVAYVLALAALVAVGLKGAQSSVIVVLVFGVLSLIGKRNKL
jgi:hypothetical protein